VTSFPEPVRLPRVRSTFARIELSDADVLALVRAAISDPELRTRSLGSDLVAKPYPCGCGRRIGFGTRRQAERGLYLDSMLPVAQRWAHLWHEATNEDRESLVRMLQGLPEEARRDEAVFDKIADAGATFRDTFLALAHRESGGVVSMSDSAAELRAFARAADDWESGAIAMMKLLRDLDREVVCNLEWPALANLSAWRAPDNRRTGPWRCWTDLRHH
jgi:hypothetical protein